VKTFEVALIDETLCDEQKKRFVHYWIIRLQI